MRKERFVGRASLGVECGGERLRLAVSRESRTREFDGQRAADHFVTLRLTVRP